MKCRKDLGRPGTFSEVVTLKLTSKGCWRNYPGKGWGKKDGVAETSAGSKALNQDRAAVKVPKETW